jgi:hypothetical protein
LPHDATEGSDEWLLLEYACVFLHCNQKALVEAVSKGTLDDLLEVLEEALEDLHDAKGPVPYANQRDREGGGPPPRRD